MAQGDPQPDPQATSDPAQPLGTRPGLGSSPDQTFPAPGVVKQNRKWFLPVTCQQDKDRPPPR